MRLVGFIVTIYHDGRSPERQTRLGIILLFNIKSPVEGTAVPKHVAVLILLMNCVLLSTFVPSV